MRCDLRDASGRSSSTSEIETMRGYRASFELPATSSGVSPRIEIGMRGGKAMTMGDAESFLTRWSRVIKTVWPDKCPRCGLREPRQTGWTAATSRSTLT